ncbi:S49 family peptidase [Ignatzschineria cameli]|uniref:S49 family peptidase n=1 Tax=Ignatzschineria cameli TaxID=2182793 RepID=A0ABX5L0S4_9GAMM|nr:S49 family peptidase [Ignatzschineria cameli]PWD83613.1 S49 family peptidase [Ignatzschineria cameli]PWD89028.1 S49 family peptidase [Ignatzschineria cameli]PWD90092.1 S49 family peptidase [Ignatzschineria cameli]PWD90755.1 S49 family peptidase [Ignatzschineria cameli]
MSREPGNHIPQLDRGALRSSAHASEGVGSGVDSARLTEALANALNSATVEARRKRRWAIFFRLLFAFLFLLMVLLFFAGRSIDSGAIKVDSEGRLLDRYTAVIDLKGIIAENSDASAARLISALGKAYQDPKAVGIILRINSGGGSPVQSGYVYDEINRLRELYPHKKLFAVIEDIGASGAYYIAAAADQIYADKASLVGSIGVTAASFGFVELMDKVGIERRLYTSGEYKAFLDPFSPQNPTETAFWKGVLDGVHQQFITAVKEGRGTRLKDPDNSLLYSGLVWNGEQALDLGLIDGLGSAASVARDWQAPALIDFTEKEDPWSKMMRELGLGVISAIKAALPQPGLY